MCEGVGGRAIGPATLILKRLREIPVIKCRPGRDTGLQQPVAPAEPAAAAAPAGDDPVAKLTQAKQMLDAGLITQEDYDALKAKVLGS